MGVSITMRPGTVMKSKGEEISITPGWRSTAALILYSEFGEGAYIELDRDDVEKLRLLSLGASVYTQKNMWDEILKLLQEYGNVVVSMQY